MNQTVVQLYVLFFIKIPTSNWQEKFRVVSYARVCTWRGTPRVICNSYIESAPRCFCSSTLQLSPPCIRQMKTCMYLWIYDRGYLDGWFVRRHGRVRLFLQSRYVHMNVLCNCIRIVLGWRGWWVFIGQWPWSLDIIFGRRGNVKERTEK